MFIKLTENEDNQEFMINIDHVEWLLPCDGKTVIKLKGDDSLIKVKEPYHKVYFIIKARTI